jgi:uncharacterized protein
MVGEMESILTQTEDYVRGVLDGEGSGHDWWHIVRVRKNAIRIGAAEDVDLFVVQLASLLHDLDDYKLQTPEASDDPARARGWMRSLNIRSEVEDHICEIIAGISFKGSRVATPMRTREGMVVQDADRLDAIGAIGVARAFTYGGSKGREIYNPTIRPECHNSFEEYKKNKGPSLNHFQEKLLLLKDLMNTRTAKTIAEERHRFMEQYVERFLREWEGLA